MNQIFVVDDSISVRKALEMTLVREGMQVRSAASGEQALEMVGSAPIDLIITDVQMTGITGFELCTSLKKDNRYSHIPILIISGSVDAETQNKAKEAGAFGVLKKPFRQEELIPIVKEAIASAPKVEQPIEKSMIDTYMKNALGVAILNSDTNEVQQKGTLPIPNIEIFIKYYVNTSSFIAKQIDEEVKDISIEMHNRTLSFKILKDKIICIYS